MIERRIPREIPTSGSSRSQDFFQSSGHYVAIVARLRRAASVLEADNELSLPAVSVSDLGRAVSGFLSDIRLGLPREDTTSNRAGSKTSGRYSRKLNTEIVDPAQAARIRKNRQDFQVELIERMRQRSKK